MTVSHIFISYSKFNQTYAYQLADELQRRGFNIWIDKIGIEYGVDWWDAIVAGLRGCGAFLVIMTPESKESKWVKREVFLAEDAEKPMFPVLLDGENWELFILTQYADVRGGALPDDDLFARLAVYVTPHGTGRNVSPLLDTAASMGGPPVSPTPSGDAFDLEAAITAFGRAFRGRQWAEALEILGRICASGEDPTPFDVDTFEAKVQAVIEAEKRAREQAAWEAERDKRYRRVLSMIDYAERETIWTALNVFWQSFPGHDPDGLAARYEPPRRFSPVTDILPAPFAWVNIPAGTVKLITERGSQTFSVPAFAIARYPVTNAQYTRFVDARGYETQRWWTDAGWQARKEESWTEPRFWRDTKWNGMEYPVVGVSWFEAVAFCRWLREVTDDETVVLPTEQQWQRAAQGDDERIYPWGNDWD
jgi:hypothetical protein